MTKYELLENAEFENDNVLILEEQTLYGTHKKLVLRAYPKHEFETDFDNSIILGFKSITRENVYEEN